MSTFSTNDFNSAAYSTYRPTYGPKLYEKVYSYHKSHDGAFDVALDVATGTGQVSSVLASTFKQVYATDTSSIMLNNAIKKPNIIYSISTAENLDQFPSSSIDLITAAQAAHWFNISEFFKESARVLKPSGTLAIWGYRFGIFKDYPRATKMINDFGVEIGKYWEGGGINLYNMFRNFKVPEDLFQEIKWEFYEGDDTKGKILMESDWSILQHAKYLKTWSSYKNYMEAHPDAEDPVDKLITEITNVEGLKHDEILHVIWRTVFILAEKK